MLWSIRERMKPALSVIEMIPDVHRTQAIGALRKAVQDGRAGDVRLSADEKELALYDGPVALISPIGARMLKALYVQGRIKLKKPPAKKLPNLDAYIATEPTFRADVERLMADEDARLDRLAQIIADPDSAQPEELTVYLVDKVATSKLGHGAVGTFRIAGLTAHRTLEQGQGPKGRQTFEEGRMLCWWTDLHGERQGEVPDDDVTLT